MNEQESKPLIAVKNLSYKAGDKYILANINWQIHKGEHWLVYGMNGSGKTTLLNIIAGFGYYTSGTVEIDGEEVSRENIWQMRKRIGWVSSSFFEKVYHKEQVIDILAAAYEGALGKSAVLSEENYLEIRDYLQKMGLENKMRAAFQTLSKGEKQKILIIRALLSKPEVIILDEAASGLDAVAAAALLASVRKMAARRDLTLIYVTHRAEEMLDIFEHIMLIKDGQIKKQGLSEQVINSANLSEILAHLVAVAKSNGAYEIMVEEQAGLF